jgi:hypothetical protein
VQSAEEVSRLISDWRAGVTEQANRFDATRRAIDDVSVTETAAGGAIVLTVESSGIPTDLRLGDDVARMKPAAIATEIMNCLRRAQTRLADRVGTLVAETAGDDASAAAIVEQYRHRFPPPPDAVDAPPAPTEENADFGLSAMAAEPAPGVAPTPVTPTPAPTARTKPTRPDDEDEDWAASPW